MSISRYAITGTLYGPREHGDKEVTYEVTASSRHDAKRVLRGLEIFPSVLTDFNGNQVSVDFRTLRRVGYEPYRIQAFSH